MKLTPIGLTYLVIAALGIFVGQITNDLLSLGVDQAAINIASAGLTTAGLLVAAVREGQAELKKRTSPTDDQS